MEASPSSPAGTISTLSCLQRIRIPSSQIFLAVTAFFCFLIYYLDTISLSSFSGLSLNATNESPLPPGGMKFEFNRNLSLNTTDNNEQKAYVDIKAFSQAIVTRKKKKKQPKGNGQNLRKQKKNRKGGGQGKKIDSDQEQEKEETKDDEILPTIDSMMGSSSTTETETGIEQEKEPGKDIEGRTERKKETENEIEKKIETESEKGTQIKVDVETETKREIKDEIKGETEKEFGLNKRLDSMDALPPLI